MEIGKQIRRARLEAGLSQRQLCEEIITRNMLSLIENGTALPSLPTLEALAGRLHKPVGYFFGETAESASADLKSQIWKALAQQKPGKAAELLQASSGQPFGPGEQELLQKLTLLGLAEQAVREDRKPYAVALLQKAERILCPVEELERKCLLLLGSLAGDSAVKLVKALPSLDEELLLRAGAALEEKDLDRAGKLLDAAEDQSAAQWGLLRGRVWYAQAQYVQAVRCFLLAENTYPGETAKYLEVCYRELEDFKLAYYYACRQKNG